MSEEVRKELSKLIQRYGIEAVLVEFIALTSPELGANEKHIADLNSRLTMALRTYQRSYETRS